MFTDYVKIMAKAGNGGDGAIALYFDDNEDKLIKNIELNNLKVKQEKIVETLKNEILNMINQAVV